tara:strand:+ start:980 stop:1099 length:120 start_codon:yes stop_codon:yes gene_type:complete
MPSQLSRSIVSMNNYKAFLAEASNLKKPFSEAGHLFAEK